MELREPVIHPTYEARYFSKREEGNRDKWSRDLDPADLKRKHWFQQYDRKRRLLLYGGFDADGNGLGFRV